MRYRRGFCSGCGQWLGDWLDKDGKELKDPPFHMVEVLHPCCELKAEAEAELREKPPEKQYGRYLAFRRMEDPEPTEAASEDP